MLRTESPIEAIFAAALQRQNLADEISIRSQVKVGPHRVDFLLALDEVDVIVECDGHAWHEKTKEQAARDKERDRELTGAGYSVLRYTGSEIVRRPDYCAEDALEHVYGIRMSQRQRLAGGYADR